MQEGIKSRSILVKDGTLFPEGFQLESASYSPGWTSVKALDGCALDRETYEAGWTFFHLAGESRAAVFGREGLETDAGSTMPDVVYWSSSYTKES